MSFILSDEELNRSIRQIVANLQSARGGLFDPVQTAIQRLSAIDGISRHVHLGQSAEFFAADPRRGVEWYAGQLLDILMSDAAAWHSMNSILNAVDHHVPEKPLPKPEPPAPVERPALVTEQAAPVANANPAVWPLVLDDMKARDGEGRRKYGVPLQPHNGRDTLVDLYQELLDAVVYTRTLIFERDGK